MQAAAIVRVQVLGLALVIGAAACGSPSDGSSGSEDVVRCLEPAGAALTDFRQGTFFSDHLGASTAAFAFPSGALVMTPSTGSLRVTGTVSTFSGFGLSFLACVDASKYSGLTFNLGGNAGPRAQHLDS